MNLNKVKELCKSKGMGIRDLERQLDVSRGAFYKWDEHVPSYKTLKKLSEILGVSIEELIE